jgi:hypothetical protein
MTHMTQPLSWRTFYLEAGIDRRLLPAFRATDHPKPPRGARINICVYPSLPAKKGVWFWQGLPDSRLGVEPGTLAMASSCPTSTPQIA